MRRFKSLIQIFFTFVVSLSASAQQPIEYVGHPNYHDITLSPDGSQYALLGVAPRQGIDPAAWHVILTKSVDDQSTIASHNPGERFYFNVSWVREDAIIAYGRSFHIKRKSAESEDVLFLINPVTGEETKLFSTQKRSIEKDANTYRNHGYSADTEEVAFSFEKSKSVELWAVNIDTRETRLLDKGPKETLDWILTKNFDPIVRIEKDKYGHIRNYLKKDEKGKWHVFRTINHLENQFEEFSIDTSNLDMQVLMRPDGAETSGLYDYSLETGAVHKIYAHEQFDSVGVGRSSFGGELLYVSWFNDIQEKHWLNPSLKSSANQLQRQLGSDTSWSMVETSLDNEVWMIYGSSPSNRGAYYVWNSRVSKLFEVDTYRTQISKSKLSQPVRINYKATDGLELSGYFTPSKKPINESQLVVIPHGGPVTRDSLRWEGWAQFLSHHGYSIWQPNFRGSGGFGKTFEYAGHGEWGQKMQTDIEDGVNHLISRGLVNGSNNRAIVGASYGGYAALAAATLTPDKYKCIISINGVTDPVALINSYDTEDPVDKYVRDVWVRRIGNPETQLGALQAISPIHNLDKVQANIMLVHGVEDEIVPFSQSQSFYDKARDVGLTVSFSKLNNVGHNYWSEYVDTKILTDIETFLLFCMD